VKWEKHKVLRNDWKKDLLVIDMVIIKHTLERGKFMRYLWFAGGTTGVVQQQQQGSTSRASIAGKWFTPMFSS